jgi:hypothetical protein
VHITINEGASENSSASATPKRNPLLEAMSKPKEAYEYKIKRLAVQEKQQEQLQHTIENQFRLLKDLVKDQKDREDKQDALRQAHEVRMFNLFSELIKGMQSNNNNNK